MTWPVSPQEGGRAPVLRTWTNLLGGRVYYLSLLWHFNLLTAEADIPSSLLTTTSCSCVFKRRGQFLPTPQPLSYLPLLTTFLKCSVTLVPILLLPLEL